MIWLTIICIALAGILGIVLGLGGLLALDYWADREKQKD